MSEIIRFPFSPLSWRIDKKQSLSSSIEEEDQNKLYTYDNINVICYSGLLETLLSCNVFQDMKDKRIYKNNSIFCHSKFNDLINILDIDYKVMNLCDLNLDNYPCPILSFDKKSIYFNTDYNIKNKISYTGKILQKQTKMPYRTIIENLLVKGVGRKINKINNLNWDSSLDKWASNNKIQFEKPFVLIMPQKLCYSSFEPSFLNWSLVHIRALQAMLNSIGYNLIVMGDKNMYNGLPFLNFSFSNFLNLAKKASVVVAEEIDFLALALFYTDAALGGRKLSKRYSIDSLKNYFQESNTIISKKDIYPIDIFNYCKDGIS